MKTLSILGTGWLGLELAKTVQTKYKIKVSSRTNEKIPLYESFGFESYLLNEEYYDSLKTLLDCNYLFINFPPSKFENYIKFLDTIYKNDKINSIEKIIFISSTSIYPKENGTYKENIKIIHPTSSIVYEGEKKVQNKTHIIFRCAGLTGGSRVLGKTLASKELLDSNSNINYIHRDDIISATKYVIENDLNGIFNLCTPHHPTKKELYKSNSLKYNFESPIFLNKFKKK